MIPEHDRSLARQSRTVALVIAATTIVWLGGQWLGRELGLPGRYSLLIDLAALAGFIWAFVVTYRLWRAPGQLRTQIC